MGRGLERSRQLRDANAVSAVIFAVALLISLPFVALLSDVVPAPSNSVLVVSWWVGAVVFSGYGSVHLLAAFVDTRQFLADHGTEYASGAEIYCHALGQRLPPLVGVGFALVFLAITGPGVDAPFAFLVVLGLFGALLLGPPTAIPMNRRVSERLAEYRNR